MKKLNYLLKAMFAIAAILCVITAVINFIDGDIEKGIIFIAFTVMSTFIAIAL